jgi:hypothetical protein
MGSGSEMRTRPAERLDLAVHHARGPDRHQRRSSTRAPHDSAGAARRGRGSANERLRERLSRLASRYARLSVQERQHGLADVGSRRATAIGDPITALELGDPGTDCNHDPCRLRSRTARQRSRKNTCSQAEVCEVQPDCALADAHLARTGLCDRNFLQLQNLGATDLRKSNCLRQNSFPLIIVGRPSQPVSSSSERVSGCDAEGPRRQQPRPAVEVDELAAAREAAAIRDVPDPSGQ